MRLALFAMVVLLAGCTQPMPETRAIPVQSWGDGTSQTQVLILGVVGEEGDQEVGYAAPVTVTVSSNGNGNVFVESPYQVAPDTKRSILDAAAAAGFVAGVPADEFDYVVTFGYDAGELSGPSAGSQFALAFYVGLNNVLAPQAPLAVREDYAGTGTISPHGSIGKVGGIPEKATALGGSAHVFAYPHGKVYSSGGWFPDAVDMGDLCGEAGLECHQVGTLADLIDVATEPAEDATGLPAAPEA